MPLILELIASLSLSLILIPLLMRLAPHIGLVDRPGPRKLHLITIPRCGGIGFAIGALLSIALWGGLEPPTAGYLAAATTVLFFGVWDDTCELSYAWKFAGQIAAVLIVMMSGAVLDRVPMMGLNPAPDWVRYSVTFLLLLGATNAFNLFDGLDGLAAGCALMSLAGLAALGWGDADGCVPAIAIAFIGGVLGFLRFNTWPATVFMGDGGSQLLGFTCAVLAVRLVGHVDPTLSPGVALLLLGVPIADTAMVIVQRTAAGYSPFLPDKNHTHHKLLQLGFRHYEAVSAGYAVQALLVGAALALRHETDIVVCGAYVAICGAALGTVALSQMKRWRLRPEWSPAWAGNRPAGRRRSAPLPGGSPLLPRACALFMAVAAGLFSIGGVLLPEAGKPEVAPLAVAAVLIIAAAPMCPPAVRQALTRCAAFVAAGLAAWAIGDYAQDLAAFRWALWGCLTVLAIVLLIAIRAERSQLFRPTPQDVLVVLILLAAMGMPSDLAFVPGARGLIMAVPIGAMIFYAQEFLLQSGRAASVAVGGSALISLLLAGMRGLLQV
jgi:UDP-GlcNAc:undecaprenyl-phosphate/decaprenyl-phosphate GlcNAc-1-phosphate transferase